MDAAEVFESALAPSGAKDWKSGYRAVRLFGESGAGGAKRGDAWPLRCWTNSRVRPPWSWGTMPLTVVPTGIGTAREPSRFRGKLIRMNLIHDSKRKAEVHYLVAGHLWGTGQRPQRDHPLPQGLGSEKGRRGISQAVDRRPLRRFGQGGAAQAFGRRLWKKVSRKSESFGHSPFQPRPRLRPRKAVASGSKRCRSGSLSQPGLQRIGELLCG